MANEGKIYILQDVPVTLTMPDGTTQVFILEKPNAGQNPFWFQIVEEAPSGQRIYKDPTRSRQKSFVDYYPEFHLSYDRHRMFTTLLLVAANIALKTPPAFANSEHYITTNCLLQNDKAVKNYDTLPALAAYSTESEAEANPIASGQEELVFIGKAPLNWQGALNYYFYQRMDTSNLLASSSKQISNDDLIISN